MDRPFEKTIQLSSLFSSFVSKLKDFPTKKKKKKIHDQSENKRWIYFDIDDTHGRVMKKRQL